MDHDRLFKELLSTFFVEFVTLFFPEVASYLDADSVVLLDKEMFTDVTSGEKHVTDLVAKARFRGVDSFFIVHVETQSSAESGFPRRMYRYFSRLHDKHALPVYPIALFSYDVPARPEPDSYEVAFPDLAVLRFQFRVVQLNQLRWRDFLDRENPVAAALMAKMPIRDDERPKVKAECLRLLVTLRLDPARTRLISGFVDSYLKLTAEEERLFRREVLGIEPEKREVVMEIVTSWTEEGIRQGLEQGRVEGRRVEALELVRRQLVRRLGTLPPEADQRLGALPVDQLEALAEALLDFRDPTHLTAWLAEPR